MRRTLLGALGLLALSSAVAPARDTLPWKDANPPERATRSHQERRTQAPRPRKPAAETVAASSAAATDVPVPEARPAERPTSPEPVDVPLPTPDGEAAKPEVRPASPAETTAPTRAPEQTQPVTAPADAAADRPVTEIPVPDERPKPSPGETAPASEPPEAEEPAPKPETQPAPEPVELPGPETAPNSMEKLKSREPAVTPAASVEAAAVVEDSMACEAELKKRGVEFAVDETISEGECGVLRPLAVKRLSSGVAVSPKTQLLCRTALALDDWMTKSVVPAANMDIKGDRLTEFRHASTYVCRPRASETGISEHARGSAIDIGSFVFASGREIGIAAKEADSPDARFLDTVRTGACGPFKTVLGPGTDPDHATHFHLDIAARTGGATYCK